MTDETHIIQTLITALIGKNLIDGYKTVVYILSKLDPLAFCHILQTIKDARSSLKYTSLAFLLLNHIEVYDETFGESFTFDIHEQMFMARNSLVEVKLAGWARDQGHDVDYWKTWLITNRFNRKETYGYAIVDFRSSDGSYVSFRADAYNRTLTVSLWRIFKMPYNVKKLVFDTLDILFKDKYRPRPDGGDYKSYEVTEKISLFKAAQLCYLMLLAGFLLADGDSKSSIVYPMRCVNCKMPLASSMCSACLNATYCDDSCQAHDWMGDHKKKCV